MSRMVFLFCTQRFGFFRIFSPVSLPIRDTKEALSSHGLTPFVQGNGWAECIRKEALSPDSLYGEPNQRNHRIPTHPSPTRRNLTC